jgi:selenocysteine-specific elongation factor
MLEEGTLRPGASALAQLRLERATVAARGDRFVIRSYSPSRTVGGGTVIEPVAEKRKRRSGGLESLAVFESGSLEARLLERLGAEAKPVAVAVLAQGLGESETKVTEALSRVGASGQVIATAPNRWLGVKRWNEARELIVAAVSEYMRKNPARYGIPKGELKSSLKTKLDASLHDAAFDALVAAGAFDVRSDRVRIAGTTWDPPAAEATALSKLEAELEAAGYSVPETSAWQSKLGASGAEVMGLGLFLGRLVRVSQEFAYTTKQMEDLRAKLAQWFESHETLNVAGFKEITGVSRKHAVPLLEHTDRVGWTVRVGDERKKGRI